MTNTFTWNLAGNGAWNFASNWLENGGTTAATVVPGAADIASFAITAGTSVVVTGQGAGGAVDFQGPGTVDLAGTFDFGSVVFGPNGLDMAFGPGNGLLTLQPGALLAVAGTTAVQGVLADAGGTATLAGTVTLGSDPASGASSVAGTLVVTNGGTVRVGAPLDFVAGGVTLDGTSVLEIGSGQTAAPGTLTVDSGGQLAVAQSVTAAADTVVAPTILNNGTISGRFLNFLTLAAVTLDGTVINNGTIANAVIQGPVINNGLLENVTASGIVNNGTILGGAISNVTGSGTVETGFYDNQLNALVSSVTIGAGVGGTVYYTEFGSITLDDPAQAPVLSGFGGGQYHVSNLFLPGITADNYIFTQTSTGYGPGAIFSGVLTLTDAGTPVAAVTTVDDSTTIFWVREEGTTAVVSSQFIFSSACFATGTRIRTPHGEVPIQDLRPGDQVATLLPEGFRPVRWIGHRTVRPASHPDPAAVRPVRVPAGAFAPGVPCRDLYLSPDHAIFAEDVLIPVRHLIGHGNIVQVDRESVTYWHVELDRHAVLLAEDLPAESYLDTGDRASFANAGEVATLHPKFGPLTWEAEGCAPLVVTGPPLDRLLERLAQRKAQREAA